MPNFVSDEVTDRFCLLGPAEAHIEKLRALARAGVTQFNIYLMCGDEEDTLEKYKKEVLPAFGKASAPSCCSLLGLSAYSPPSLTKFQGTCPP